MPSSLCSEKNWQGHCALACKHTHSPSVCFAYCPVPAHPSQRQLSFCSITWKTLWTQLLAQPQHSEASRMTPRYALFPQNLWGNRDTILKDSLKLGSVSLDGPTQPHPDLTGAFTTSPFKRKHRSLRVKTPGFTSPLQHQLSLWTWAC